MTKLYWTDLRRRLSLPLEDLTPYAASAVVLRLGGVARWCLKPDVLRVAAEDDAIPQAARDAWRRPPRVPADHGSCWVIFAANLQGLLPLLQPAFVLPLRWVEGRPHSAKLPAAVGRLAERVAEVFAEDNRMSGRQWGLELGDDLAGADLSEMPLECDSGWAALAAGLLVAAEGGTPDPRVWATGSWDDRGGIRQVELLEQKLNLARASGVTAFFVPASQGDEAARWASGIEIGRLRTAERDPRRALVELTLRLETPPPPPIGSEDVAGLERCIAYYLKRPRGELRTTQFYWTHLLPPVTQRCRSQVLAEYGDCQPSRMVTIVSGSPELVLLAARALDVKRCLLLYTPHDADARRDQTQAMQMVQGLLEADGRDCLPAAFEDSRSLESQIPEAVRRFGAGQPPEALVLDLTPGNKWMTWVADRAMPAGSWRLYIRNDTLTAPDRRPRPGSEQLICWQVP